MESLSPTTHAICLTRHRRRTLCPHADAVSLTVGKLKLMLDRLLRVKAGAQALLLVPPEGSEAQVRAAAGLRQGLARGRGARSRSECLARGGGWEPRCALRRVTPGLAAAAARPALEARGAGGCGWKRSAGLLAAALLPRSRRTPLMRTRGRCLDPSPLGPLTLLSLPPTLLPLQPEDITDEDARELRYFDVCDGCRSGTPEWHAHGSTRRAWRQLPAPPAVQASRARCASSTCLQAWPVRLTAPRAPTPTPARLPARQAGGDGRRPGGARRGAGGGQGGRRGGARGAHGPAGAGHPAVQGGGAAAHGVRAALPQDTAAAGARAGAWRWAVRPRCGRASRSARRLCADPWCCVMRFCYTLRTGDLRASEREGSLHLASYSA